MVRTLTAALMVFTFGETQQAAIAVVPDCVRLSGSQIGQLPLVVQVGGHAVEFIEWKATDISAKELVGFTAHAPNAFRFTVEAGGSTLPASANWLHPAGVVGRQVKPIHTLTVCAN